MPFYKNKQGDSIEVTKEHIETAIRIKIELQKLSPSGKCNWRTHKTMMIEEGYHDSDVSENYRVFIREHQRRLNLLPTTSEYANFISDKKLEAIKSFVGEMNIVKRNVQNENRFLNKTKREIADELIVIDEIKQSVKEHIPNIKINKPNKVKDKQEVFGLVTPSDWHIGLKHRDLSFQDAECRIKEYANRVIEECFRYDIETVYVANLGDIVNHVYMHKNTQAYSSEFNVSEQIVKASKVMFEFLIMLSSELNVIYLGTISGNHGRMSNKGETLTGDSVEFVVDSMIREMIEVTKVCDSLSDVYHTDYINFKIFDKEILLVHGDKEKSKGQDVIQKYSSMLNKQIDLVVKGHTHTYKVETENHGRKIITSGCLMGSDDYAESLGYKSTASQIMTVITENDIIPLDFTLK